MSKIIYLLLALMVLVFCDSSTKGMAYTNRFTFIESGKILRPGYIPDIYKIYKDNVTGKKYLAINGSVLEIE
jgi:hypothetical protein